MIDRERESSESGRYQTHSFRCMGGLCEILTETADAAEANRIFEAVRDEARRIEAKFSRYSETNVVHAINHAEGREIAVDEETLRLLGFAGTLYEASDGMFDVTSGVLREAWTFDGGTAVPETSFIERLVRRIGWPSVEITEKTVRIPAGWQLDLGGIGKEYAVDSCRELARRTSTAPTLVNLGGDIAVTGPKRDGSAWKIHLDQSDEALLLAKGAVATSGDKNKFVIHEGRRLSHILNPKTGWPVENAPRSVSVVASTCVEAGALATLALLRGSEAESFLAEETENYRVLY